MRDINPLNVLNQREVSIMPPHFTKINHKINYMGSGRTHNDIVNHIKNWIFNNLDVRFTFTEYSQVPKESQSDFFSPTNYDVNVTIGFEVPEESTFFSLAYQTEEQNSDSY